jgi:hypothetical protein
MGQKYIRHADCASCFCALKSTDIVVRMSECMSDSFEGLNICTAEIIRKVSQ